MPSRLVLFCAAALVAAAPASAQTFGTFQFADTSGNPVSNFSIAGVGGTADVRLYLLETDGQSSLRNTGLFSAEVRVSFNNPAGVAAVLAATDIARNPAFDQQLGTSTSAASAILNEQALSNPAVASPATDPNRVYLGTFHFTAQSAGSVTLTADSPVTSGGTILNDFTDISSRISSTNATLTVSPVPEPATLGWAVAAAAGLSAAYRRWRRTPRAGSW
jgi:hypothetical protein